MSYSQWRFGHFSVKRFICHPVKLPFTHTKQVQVVEWSVLGAVPEMKCWEGSTSGSCRWDPCWPGQWPSSETMGWSTIGVGDFHCFRAWKVPGLHLSPNQYTPTWLPQAPLQVLGMGDLSALRSAALSPQQWSLLPPASSQGLWSVVTTMLVTTILLPPRWIRLTFVNQEPLL